MDLSSVSAPGIRLHMLALPHTITRPEFSHCAFTGKVLRFAPMMRSQGYEVYHYGVETSESGADVQIDVLSLHEWKVLRVKSYMQIYKCTYGEAAKILSDDKAFIGALANYSTPLYEMFNARLRVELVRNYRGVGTDIVCLPFDVAHNAALAGLNVVTVETGIGYETSFSNYRIFESNAVMHKHMSQYKKGTQNYWFVVPNYFDTAEFVPAESVPTAGTRPRIGYFGRIGEGKGCSVFKALAQCFPDIDFVMCGQGDASPYLGSPNVFYEPPVHGAARLAYLQSLRALVVPSMYLEPFAGVCVEAQLCGLPVLTTDCGAFTETVTQGRSGYRCHTLADFRYGVEQVMRGHFDPAYIRARAVRKYDMFNVAREYDVVFRTIMDVHNGAGGWYSTRSYLSLCEHSAPLASGSAP